MAEIDFEKERRVIAGPYSLFDGSMVGEFLEADDVDATFFCRFTMPAKHPLLALGKKHPVSPPLHVHLDQSEQDSLHHHASQTTGTNACGRSFKILKGKWGVTTGWDQKDTILTPDNDIFVVLPMLPHTPWPVACEEETVMFAWGHPTGTPKPLSTDFFRQIFLYTQDLFTTNKSPDLLQLLLMQHETNSTGVMFPSLTFLGPLRWWIPLRLQGAIASFARLLGYSKDMPQYLKQQ